MVQLNIFLAILIEGYNNVKESTNDSHGILEELSGIAIHEIHRVMQLVSKGPASFISDDQLEADLTAMLISVPTTMNRAIKDYAAVALGHYMEVLITITQTCHNQVLFSIQDSERASFLSPNQIDLD